MKMNMHERAVIAILSADTPAECIENAHDVLPFIDDEEMIKLIQTVIQKLQEMTIEEYKSLDLPEFEDDTDDTNEDRM